MERPIRIGTRRSKLAMAQTQEVIDLLQKADESLTFETVGIVTRGDRTSGPLYQAGGKGLFTADLEEALRRGEIDLAVHSAKDVPVDISDEFVIAAIVPRTDPRDALVSKSGYGVEQLPTGASVGTSSLRRSAQLIAARNDIRVVPIRGNVETRLEAVLGCGGEEELDAAILAMAGMIRIGLDRKHSGCISALDAARFIPAAGQGTLLVQCLAHGEAASLVRPLDDCVSSQAVLAEREVLRALGANCHSCIGVHIFGQTGQWSGRAMVARADGSKMLNVEVQASTAQVVAAELVSELRERGAVPLLGS